MRRSRASFDVAASARSDAGARRPRRRDDPAILCTLGPASLDPRTIRRLEQCGATLFRVNLSHTDLADLAATILRIRAAASVPVCLDTEGAQIRTGTFVEGSITLRDNTVVRVHAARVPGDDKNFNLYPRDIALRLERGDFVSLDFHAALAQVIATDEDGVLMRVLRGGPVGQNKAVTVERDIPLPPLTEKDRAAVELGRDLGLTHFALSFAASGEDVQALRSLAGKDAFVISKIETTRALTALDDIAAASDALLIDRGDLSRQVPLEVLPQTQKHVIARAKRLGKPIYVATNLLESMVSSPAPTRAEVNDIYNTLADGADGLVLAAETAIGRYPIACASMVAKVVRGYRQPGFEEGKYYPLDAVSLLVEPHGGRLVHREATAADRDGIDDLPRFPVDEYDLLDCEQIAYGTYSPLTGFMNREALESVLDDHRLPSGEVWTLPVLLQVDAGHAGGEAAEAVRSGRVAVGERVALVNDAGTVHALLDVHELFRADPRAIAERTFATNDLAHPGVARMVSKGDTFVAGDVTLVEPTACEYRHYLLTPAQTRFIFTRLGWSQVVGFHGRNPAHRGHEAIQLEALERSGADGIYINPVTGPKKRGDFLPEPILRSYQALLEFGYYPKGKVVLGSFFTYSRYAGPREAVFTALCRKNMGCSHFIVGRDHAGVGDFYPEDGNRRLFDALGDIGVTPMFFDPIGYDISSRSYVVDRGQAMVRISGTTVRETLRANRRLPDWFMRDLVQEVLVADRDSGKPLFYD